MNYNISGSIGAGGNSFRMYSDKHNRPFNVTLTSNKQSFQKQPEVR